MLTAVLRLLLLPGILLLTISNLFATNIDSLRHAAEVGGDAQAAARLSVVLRMGIGTSVNPTLAYSWAQVAAKSQQAFPVFCLAECLRTGNGTAMDLAAAHALYDKCVPALRSEAAQNDPYVLCAVSMCFAHGLGTGVREDSAQSYLHRAADLWFAPACHEYYKVPLAAARSERDSLVAMAMLRYAADQLYLPAMAELAATLSQVPSTEDLAYLYARRAAALNSADAAYQCGAFCYAGIGTPRDTAQSERWFVQAAAGGLLKAHAELGYRYAKGIGVVANAHSARVHFLKALALQREERRGLRQFIHQQLDTLKCSQAEWDSCVVEACHDLREMLSRSGYPSDCNQQVLSGNLRRLWKVYDPYPIIEKGNSYLGFTRAGKIRSMEFRSDTLMETEEQNWSLSEDLQQLRSIADDKHDSTIAHILLLSPGAWVSQYGSRIVVFERAQDSLFLRLEAFKNLHPAFGEPKLVLRKAEITDKGAVRLHIVASNIPADGITLSLDSIRFVTEVVGQNDRKQTLIMDGPQLIFNNGEFSVVVDVRGQIKRSINENHCQFDIVGAYNIDEAYHQIVLHTPEVNLPQVLK